MHPHNHKQILFILYYLFDFFLSLDCFAGRKAEPKNDKPQKVIEIFHRQDDFVSFAFDHRLISVINSQYIAAYMFL